MCLLLNYGKEEWSSWDDLFVPALIQTAPPSWEEEPTETEKVNRHGVTDLHKNSRYPGLARAVLFPILLLVVCKEKKINHKLFHCVLETAFTRVSFPHSIWSESKSRSRPRGIGKGREGYGGRPITWRGPEKGVGGRGLEGTRAAVLLRLQKYWAWIGEKKGKKEKEL